MLSAVGSGLVALACMAASAVRLARSVEATSLEPAMLLNALSGRDGLDVGRLTSAVGLDSRYRWEHELLVAFAGPPGPSRDGLVNEQVLELEGRAEQWSRVPRVCASVGSSAGFFFASIALLIGSGSGTVDAVVIQGGMDGPLRAAFEEALGAFALGIVAATFCMAVHVRASRAAGKRRAAMNGLVDRLRFLSDTASPQRT